MPANWTEQLTAIILLFGIGLSCFPLGLVIECVFRPDYQIYTYNGPFEADLSASTPMVNLSLWRCYKIEIEASAEDFSLVTIRILNAASAVVLSIPPLADNNETGSFTVMLERDVETELTMEIEWIGQPLLFQCYIIAYTHWGPVYMRIPAFEFWWLLGSLLIIVGFGLAIHFVKRTKAWY